MESGHELSALCVKTLSNSFEVSEMIVRKLIFYKLFNIFIIYNAHLHMCDSNLTWK